MSKNFLWGSSISGGQCEGGMIPKVKLLSI